MNYSFPSFTLKKIKKKNPNVKALRGKREIW